MCKVTSRSCEIVEMSEDFLENAARAVEMRITIVQSLILNPIFFRYQWIS